MQDNGLDSLFVFDNDSLHGYMNVIIVRIIKMIR